MPLTQALREDYEKRFASCTVRPERKQEVENVITRIMESRPRYQAVSRLARVPWFVIAVIHNMECSGRFDCHLHNGNSLRARTHDEPAGRPHDGKPPFTWEASAIDALEYEGFDVWTDWSVAGTLYKLELYNGSGYRNRNVPTPYLWAASQHDLNHDGRVDADEDRFGYRAGKFVRDGKFDPHAKSAQIGAAVLLRRMVDQNLFDLPIAQSIDPKCKGVV